MMMLVPEAYKNHPTLSIKYPEVWDALVKICWACMKALSYLICAYNPVQLKLPWFVY
jgi:hypothetical protein